MNRTIVAVSRASSELSLGKSAVIARLSEATDVNINATMKRLGGKMIAQRT